MNNNRGNNRRRGRGNNRQQGGGQPLNRVDSRARGNAPQLLEKYRKLAHDAHLNGDRVTEEYYLQFSDHYFRVIADQRQRQEDARQSRQDRWQDGNDGDRYDADGGDDAGDADYPAAPYNYGERRERTEERVDTASGDEGGDDRAQTGGASSGYEPAENPFTRDNRAVRGQKPRRPRREGEGSPRDDNRAPQRGADADNAPSQLDLAVLPPAIAPREEPADDAAETAEAKPKRRVTRRAKPAADDSGETRQLAGG